MTQQTQRGPRYYRISPRFWQDEKVVQWDDDTRLLALYLLTCPHRNMVGLFVLPLAYAAADLGWDVQRLQQPFQKLLADGFIEYDENRRIILIVNALKYDSPSNPNQVTAAVRAVEELPETPLLERLLTLSERFCKPLAKRLQERFAERFGKPVRNTVTVTVTATAATSPTVTGKDTAVPLEIQAPPVDNLGIFAKAGFGCFSNLAAQFKADLAPAIEQAFPGKSVDDVWPEILKVLRHHCKVMKERDWCEPAQPRECRALVVQALAELRDEIDAGREIEKPVAYLQRILDRLRRMESDTWSERRARLRPAGGGVQDLESIFAGLRVAGGATDDGL